MGSLEKMVMLNKASHGYTLVFVEVGTIEEARVIADRWVAQGCPLGEGMAESFPEITRYKR